MKRILLVLVLTVGCDVQGEGLQRDGGPDTAAAKDLRPGPDTAAPDLTPAVPDVLAPVDAISPACVQAKKCCIADSLARGSHSPDYDCRNMMEGAEACCTYAMGRAKDIDLNNCAISQVVASGCPSY